MRGRRLRVVLRYRPPASELPPFVAGSLLFHVGFSAALAILPSFHARPKPLDDAWIVGLTALPGPRGSGGPAAAVAAAPARPAPPKEGTRLEEPKPSPKPDKSKTKKKEEKKTPATEPALPPAGPAAPPGGSAAPSPGPAATGAAGGPGPAGAPGGIFALDAGDARFAWYRASVTAALQGQWIRPVLEGVRSTLAVTVTFEIARDGVVRNAAVETSSGVPSLDRSALRAVEQSSPLPPLPSGIHQDPFSARFEFRWSPGA